MKIHTPMAITGLIVLTLFSVILSAAAEEANSPPASRTIETYAPPKPIKLKPPGYPKSNQRHGREGWVHLSYMVDATGKPYDLNVAGSSGNSLFEAAAIKAAHKFTYTPASLNGMSIDAGISQRITFELAGGKAGAGAGFVRKFKNVISAVLEDNKQNAERHLNELQEKSNNLYEEAYLNVAKLNFYKKWGSLRQQHSAVNRATYMDQGRGFLPDNQLTSLLWNRLDLELKLSMFAYALSTAGELSVRKLTDDKRSRLATVREKIVALRNTDNHIAVSDRVRDDNRAIHRLFRSSFAISDIKGDIAELRLHCDKGYVGFVFDPEVRYRVGKGWSNCTLVVIGDPGTTFRLVEL